MAIRDTRVDKYITQARPDAVPVLERLRAIVHTTCPEVTETIKWSAPAFDYHGPMFFVAAHKHHCSAGFWKAEQMHDPSGYAVRLEKMVSLDDLPPDAELVGLIRQHMKLNEQAVAAKKQKKPTVRSAAGGEGATLRFKAIIQIREGNPYVLISANRAGRIKPGWRRPMPVLVQLNGKPEAPWRINMMPVGDGSFYLYLHGDVRQASSTGVGDQVTINIRFDAAYKGGPEHDMPEWFLVPLARHETAQSNWNALPPSRKKEVLRYFAGLKSDEAKQRNLKKALHVLSGKPGRFMARDWQKGK